MNHCWIVSKYLNNHNLHIPPAAVGSSETHSLCSGLAAAEQCRDTSATVSPGGPARYYTEPATEEDAL